MKYYFILILFLVGIVGLIIYLNNKKSIEGFNSTPPFTSTGGFTSGTSLKDIENTLKFIDEELKMTGESFQTSNTNTINNATTNTTSTTQDSSGNVIGITQKELDTTKNYVDRTPSKVEVPRTVQPTTETKKEEPKKEEPKKETCPPRINIIQVPVDLSKYVLKTSLKPSNSPDMSKYILKTKIPSCEKPDPNKYILKSKIPACMPVPIEEPKPIKKMTDIKETILKFVKSPDNPLNIDNCRFAPNNYVNLDNRPNIKFNTNPTDILTPTSRPIEPY